MRQHFRSKLIFALFAGTVLFYGCKNDSGIGPLYKLAVQENFPCEDGLAAGLYPCDNIGLFAHIPMESFGSARANDIWGWTDPLTGKEYALVGLNEGVSFVDISDPNNPVIVGKLPESIISSKRLDLSSADYEICEFGIGTSETAKTLTEGSVWRDHKVYKNHLYIVSDAQAHGMQVFDLTRLRDFSGEAITFEEDAHYSEFANAHNIVINEATGFAYAVGATNNVRVDFVNDCNDGGLHMIDISSPKNPTFSGCYSDAEPPRRSANSPYIHDAQCVVYNGPDVEHRGKEICFSSAERSSVITDVTDKSNPITLGYDSNPNVQYSHQGWLTEDHSYFIMNDELDEANLGRNTKTHIFDVRDLDNPTFVGSYDHPTFTIDHNLYIKNNYIFLSNYTSGFRTLKFGNLSDMDIEQIAFFDTQPDDQELAFRGAWSNYPYFKSGVIIVSDINDGLFILKPNF